MQTLILSGRFVHESLKGLFGATPACMVPLHGEVLLDRMLKSIPDDFRGHIAIAIGEGGERIMEHCGGLADGVPCPKHFITVDPRASAGEAMAAALSMMPNLPTLVLLGDTLVDLGGRASGDCPVIFTSPTRPQSSEWSYVRAGPDSRIEEFISDLSREVLPPADAMLVVGAYYLPAVQGNDVNSGGRVELHGESRRQRSILQVLLARFPGANFRAEPVSFWLDFGHLDSYQHSKKYLLASRSFNRLEFDDLRGTVRKTSLHQEKFAEEIMWYSEMPADTRVLAPRVVSSSLGESRGENCSAHLELEYYGYPSLAELWVHREFDASFYRAVLARIFQILTVFRLHQREVPPGSCEAMYWLKTISRLDEFSSHSAEAANLLRCEQLVVNGVELDGWPKLEARVRAFIPKLLEGSVPCFIHGDLCFSNILYDPGSGILRLIDPRGRWGGEIGSGDQRYDIAKLRHSVVGMYDFIIARRYVLRRESAGCYSFQVRAPSRVAQVQAEFDALTAAIVSVETIKFIEGLLFMSMLPLHGDDWGRQQALFITGVVRLNEVFGGAVNGKRPERVVVSHE